MNLRRNRKKTSLGVSTTALTTPKIQLVGHFITEDDWKFLPHPAYSPDLAPSLSLVLVFEKSYEG
jgi:hypothetical protein